MADKVDDAVVETSDSGFEKDDLGPTIDEEQIVDLEDLLVDGGKKDAEQPGEDDEASEGTEQEAAATEDEGSEETEESSEDEEDESEPEDEKPSYDELLERLARREARDKKKSKKEVDEEEEESEEPEAEVASNFLDGKHFDDMSSKEIESLLKRVVDTAVEKALLLTPKVAMEQSKQYNEMQALANRFYSDNPDLVERKELVKMVTVQLQSENPDLPYNKLLDKVAKKSREILGIKKGMKKEATVVEEKPKPEANDLGLKKVSSSRGAPPSESKQKSLVDDIASTIFD